MGRVDPAIIGGTVRKLAQDPDPAVRLQVAIAARKLENADAMHVLLEVLSRAGDDVVTPPVVWQNLQPMLESGAYAFVEATENYPDSKAVEAIYPRVIDRLLEAEESRLPVKPIAVLLDRLIEGQAIDLDERVDDPSAFDRLKDPDRRDHWSEGRSGSPDALSATPAQDAKRSPESPWVKP